MMTSLIDLRPDYAIALEPCENKTRSSYSSVISALEESGFYVEARPGDLPQSVVLFIKLSGEKLTDLAQQDSIRCLEYGTKSPLSLQADRFYLIDRFLSIDLGLAPRTGKWKCVTSLAPLPQQVFSLQVPGMLAFSNSESIDDITKDYGVPVGLYFEFLKYYTSWLMGLSVFGVAFFVFYNKTFSYTFTCINMVWGIMFLTFWNYKQGGFLKKWGGDKALMITLDEEEAQLKCKHASNYIRQLAFVPIAIGAAAALAGFQLLCFALEIFLTQIYNGPFQFALKLIPTIALQTFIPAFSIAYKLLAQLAIAREGQECERRNVESMTIKLFVLNFLTNYMPLLITAFIYLPFGHFVQPYLPEIRSVIAKQFSPDRFFYKYVVQIKSQKEYLVNQERLNEQYFFAMVAGQVITFTLKYVVPLVAARVTREVKARLNNEKKPTLEPVAEFAPGEKEFSKRVNHLLRLPAYDVVDEYRSFVIQYGFLIMFGPVWPLAPLILALFNYVNYKLDNFKLRTGIYAKYPVPQRAATMQLWMYALYGLTWLGLIVSPMISAFYRHGTKLPKSSGQASIHVLSTAILIMILFASEHFFFISTYLLSKLISAIDSDHTSEDEYSEKLKSLKLKFAKEQVSKQKRDIPSDDSVWSKRTSKSALDQVDSILNESSSAPLTQEPILEKALLSGSQVSNNQAVNRKLEKLQARKKELLEERAFLENSQEKGDRIIEVTDADGNKHLSTIDNNSHAIMSSTSVNRDSVAEEARLSRTLDSSTSSLPLEKGDSKVFGANDEGKTVASTIDNNEHASLSSSAEDNVATEAAKSKSLPSDTNKGNQKKGKLKKA